MRERAVALGRIALGLFLIKYAKPYLNSVAFEDDVYNAPVAGVALVLGIATVVAALVPAMRATRLDPTGATE